MLLGRSFWICAFFLLVSLPGAQTLFHFMPEAKTNGVENRVFFPEISLPALWDGKFQVGFEKWLATHIGFRGMMARTDNQINFTVFDEFASNSRFQVVLGKDAYLFERGYISSYVHSKPISDKGLKKTVSKLKRLQDLLRERGKGFLLLISPSKASIYEDYLPQTYRRRRRPGPTSYDLLVPMLDAAGVNYVDGVSLSRAFRNEGKPAFSRGGTHWSYYLSCYVSAAIMQKYSQLMGVAYQSLNCEPAPISVRPNAADSDLSLLSNLWSYRAFNNPLPYPIMPSSAQLAAFKDVSRPSLVAVGTSFMWSIWVYLDAFQAYAQRDFYFYFRTKHSYPSGKKSVIDPKTFSWESEVFSKDLVLVEANQYDLEHLGHSFVGNALKQLGDSDVKKSAPSKKHR